MQNSFSLRKPLKQTVVYHACINCRIASISCTKGERPCKRCKILGISDTCVQDVRTSLQKNGHHIHSNAKPNFHFCKPNELQQINNNNNNNKKKEDLEKIQLLAKLKELQQQKNQQIEQLTLLKQSLQTRNIFSNIPTAKWKLLCPGYCRLLSYSTGFKTLISQNSDNLANCFTCVQLYPSEEFCKTTQFFDLLNSGKVSSLIVNVPLRSSNKIISATCMIKLEFVNNIPATVSTCYSVYDPKTSKYGKIKYFTPYMVKLREINDQINKKRIKKQSNSVNYTQTTQISQHTPTVSQQSKSLSPNSAFGWSSNNNNMPKTMPTFQQLSNLPNQVEYIPKHTINNNYNNKKINIFENNTRYTNPINIILTNGI